MELTTSDIEHLAKLARLSISENEIEKYKQDLPAILDYLGSLSVVTVTSEDETTDQTLRLRPDQVEPFDGPFLIDQLPGSAERLLSVPPVFNND